MSNNKGGSRKRRRSPEQITAAIEVAVVKIGSVAVRMPIQIEDTQENVIADIAREAGVSKDTVRGIVSFSTVPDDIGDRLFVKCQQR